MREMNMTELIEGTQTKKSHALVEERNISMLAAQHELGQLLVHRIKAATVELEAHEVQVLMQNEIKSSIVLFILCYN